MLSARSLCILALAALLGACSRSAPAAAQAEGPSQTGPVASAPPAPPPGLEFVGLEVTDARTTVVVLDRATELRHRIDVGQSVAGIEVVSFDGTKDEIAVRAGGHTATLGLRSARPGPGSEADASTPTLPGALLTEAMSAPHLTNSTAASAPAGAPEAVAAVTDDRAREVAEREARMLVSDLLEISQIQRRAFEQKKAAEEAVARGEAPPTVQ